MAAGDLPFAVRLCRVKYFENMNTFHEVFQNDLIDQEDITMQPSTRHGELNVPILIESSSYHRK